LREQVAEKVHFVMLSRATCPGEVGKHLLVALKGKNLNSSLCSLESHPLVIPAKLVLREGGGAGIQWSGPPLARG
ncbi:MAG: hypothetical protein ACRD22_19280, partial [Terriglobia bacterium]